MKTKIYTLALGLIMMISANAQDISQYDVQITPVTIDNLPGLHSYAFGESDGKWLIIGGRLDGIHARQPFNAFNANSSNTNLYVVDIKKKKVWSASINALPTAMAEQLQSTNMNFTQVGDTLYIIGGYAFSATANDHITFPYLTTIHVSKLMENIMEGKSITNDFKQITDTAFAVTGGHLGILNNTFLLVGGQKFSGAYNPLGHNTYVQQYTNQIRKFKLNNAGSTIVMSDYSTITDEVHLHRRDYNLLPQIFADKSLGYMISSGVFQIDADLPFLYPVNITATGYTPKTDFNQYLSNYHSATAHLYDKEKNEMHSIFFGGLSQYYHKNGDTIQDDKVPFVKTISRVSRLKDGSLVEYKYQTEMPGYLGASAEFLPDEEMLYGDREIMDFNNTSKDTIYLGHIFGGIKSTTINPFSDNRTTNTSADNVLYRVALVKKGEVGTEVIDGENPYNFTILGNPSNNVIKIQLDQNMSKMSVRFMVMNTLGTIISKGSFDQTTSNIKSIVLPEGISSELVHLTIVVNDRYTITKNVILK